MCCGHQTDTRLQQFRTLPRPNANKLNFLYKMVPPHGLEPRTY